MTPRLDRLRRLSLRGAAAAGELRTGHLLMAAAVFHVAVCVALNLIGRFQLLPNLFDENGISSPLAFDSFYYRRKCMQLVAALAQGEFTAWFYSPFPIHVKIYSLSFAVMSPLFGYTMLGAEPLNLSYYLLILVLVFQLAREVFDRRAALLASAMVALWPSFLLHTTQLLRDPMFIVLMLTLLLIGTRWLTREHSLRRALLEGMAGAALSALVWLTRVNFWKPLLGFILLAAVLLIIRQLRERRWLAGNLAGALLMLGLMGFAPVVVSRFLLPDSSISEYPKVELESPPSPCGPRLPHARLITEHSSVWSRLLVKADRAVERLADRRVSFALAYPGAGSNIDVCARLNSVEDLLRYLPRAMANGSFAPYPAMWLATGNAVGFAGRLLSGLEMLALYLIELLAVAGLWKGRRRLSPWFLALIVWAGLMMLGLYVVNLAVLFRVRYIFCMLLIVLGAGGATHILFDRPQKKSVSRA